MSMTLPFPPTFGFKTANGWRIAVSPLTQLHSQLLAIPAPHRVVLSRRYPRGKHTKDNFPIQKIQSSSEHRAEISWEMERFGKNYWKHSVQELWEHWEPPDFSILQASPRVWDFGTKSFVQLERQIIPSCSRSMIKTCQIYLVGLGRSAEGSLQGERHPGQNKGHVMMIPNPPQGWSSSCTSVAAECSQI